MGILIIIQAKCELLFSKQFWGICPFFKKNNSLDRNRNEICNTFPCHNWPRCTWHYKSHGLTLSSSATGWEMGDFLAVLRKEINFSLILLPQKLSVKVNFLCRATAHRKGRDQGPNCEAEREKSGEKMWRQWTHANMPCGIPLTLIL